ncbi:hypothetical protein BDV30DRAFT_214599 [Aspergillus minisclerotigenes]|uniref:Uncharacterized protein n=1 Tax=Aspergillus minisclerotigenes TaxID=656917 RepID=A0A5N6IVQ4_9EURO|nr:hypothetical protein BDV30DRAFT_214599 [Aspergillus minisclerotigenes]
MLAVELDDSTEFGLELTLGKWVVGLMMTEHLLVHFLSLGFLFSSLGRIRNYLSPE